MPLLEAARRSKLKRLEAMIRRDESIGRSGPGDETAGDKRVPTVGDVQPSDRLRPGPSRDIRPGVFTCWRRAGAHEKGRNLSIRNDLALPLHC